MRLLIRLGQQPTEAATQQAVARVREGLEKSVPGAKVVRTDAVGASVSAELFRNGLLALAISLAMILVYIWFRFEWQFGVGATLSTLHDVVTTVGLFAIFGGEDGMRDVEGVLVATDARLRRDGWLLMEFGFGQEEDIRQAIARHPALRLDRVVADLQGLPRTIVAQRL